MDYRKDFKLLNKVIYLDSASAWIIPKEVSRAWALYYKEQEKYWDILWDKWLNKVEGYREIVADFLSCQNNEISFQVNTWTWMNIITSFFERWDEIILNDLEFPTSNLPWIWKWFNLKYVKSRDYKIYIEDIEKQITNKTKAVVISWVNTFTWFKIDLLKLSALCKSKWIKLIVNASQWIWAYKLDLSLLDIDFVVFTWYKRLLAWYWIACLYINRKNFWTQKYEIFCGWMSAKEPHDVINNSLIIKEDAKKFDIWSPHFAWIFAIWEAIKYLQVIWQDDIEEKINNLTNYLILKLKENSIKITSPVDDENELSWIIYIKPDNYDEIKRQLVKNKTYVVSYENGIRISLHFYNNYNDIDRFMVKLKELLIN